MGDGVGLPASKLFLPRRGGTFPRKDGLFGSPFSASSPAAVGDEVADGAAALCSASDGVVPFCGRVRVCVSVRVSVSLHVRLRVVFHVRTCASVQEK